MTAATMTRAEELGMTVTLWQPTIGAEISGIDLRRDIDDEVRDAVKELLLQYKVLFFRDQDIDHRQQARFAARFGNLYIHPISRSDHPETPAVHRVALDDYVIPAEYRDRAHRVDGDPAATKPTSGSSRPSWDGYHTDTSWRLIPAWGAVLRAVTLPPVGGDTIWVDANLAYESLEQPMKDRLKRAYVAHDFRFALNAAGFMYPLVAHPVVRTHRETGRKILWVNYSHNPSIIGRDRAESNEILNRISDAYRKPEYQVRFSWRPNSVAFWDNRSTVHYGVTNYGDQPRLLERVLIDDDRTLADL
ncbi:TauD/TfdA dioxygenase family protein [Nocardia sp. NPDC052566]|uniref:TauD/TfdA dioxygenase family protein n=1 Tax=Nocardia sp. NPDC052566 TaxID=3364330 RepID=UPI0037C6D00A